MLRIIAILAFMLHAPAFAYLDPGTGSLLLSSVVAIFASLIFFSKGLFYKLKNLSMGGGSSNFLKSKFSKKSKNSQDLALDSTNFVNGIVVYSEGRQYYNVFKPIIDYFDSISYPYTYLASDERDLALKRESKSHAHIEFIGLNNSGFMRLNTLEADIVLMTTPQLDVLQLRRSKKVKHYCHIIHSPPHVDIYEVFALDYFDSVFTNSPIHTDFIRELESIRGTKHKQITITGCTYLDVLKERLDSLKKSDFDVKRFFAPNDKLTILISPSWGRESLLHKYGIKLLAPLLKADVNLIIRPHPQSLLAETQMLDSLKEQMSEISDCKNVAWDSNMENIYAMSEADIMIGDFSGVIFDFICLFKKPVITMEFHFNTIGYDLEDTGREPWVKGILPTLGYSLKPSEIDNIAQIAQNLLRDKTMQEKVAKNIADLKELLWQYEGVGGEKSAIELLKIHKEILTERLGERRREHLGILELNKIFNSETSPLGGNSPLGNLCGSVDSCSLQRTASPLHSQESTQPTNLIQDARILEANLSHSHTAKNLESSLRERETNEAIHIKNNSCEARKPLSVVGGEGESCERGRGERLRNSSPLSLSQSRISESEAERKIDSNKNENLNLSLRGEAEAIHNTESRTAKSKIADCHDSANAESHNDKQILDFYNKGQNIASRNDKLVESSGLPLNLATSRNDKQTTATLATTCNNDKQSLESRNEKQNLESSSNKNTESTSTNLNTMGAN